MSDAGLRVFLVCYQVEWNYKDGSRAATSTLSRTRGDVQLGVDSSRRLSPAMVREFHESIRRDSEAYGRSDISVVITNIVPLESAEGFRAHVTDTAPEPPHPGAANRSSDE